MTGSRLNFLFMKFLSLLSRRRCIVSRSRNIGISASLFFMDYKFWSDFRASVAGLLPQGLAILSAVLTTHYLHYLCIYNILPTLSVGLRHLIYTICVLITPYLCYLCSCNTLPTLSVFLQHLTYTLSILTTSYLHYLCTYNTIPTLSVYLHLTYTMYLQHLTYTLYLQHPTYTPMCTQSTKSFVWGIKKVNLFYVSFATYLIGCLKKFVKQWRYRVSWWQKVREGETGHVVTRAMHSEEEETGYD